MNKNERLKRIASLLQSEKCISVHALAQQFEVSEMTIRRDLKSLKESNPIGIYGGTVVKIGQTYDLNSEEYARNEDKRTIGAFAASLIAPNDIIFLDMGSTTIHIAENLPTDFHFTVLCNSANILMELLKAPNIDIKVAGGSYHRSTGMFTSMQGIE